MMGHKQIGLLAGLIVCGAAINGCQSVSQRASGQSGDQAVGSSEKCSEAEISGLLYEDVFRTTRDVLRSYRFGINRVDAARGVMTTFPKRSVGVASIWDQEQSSANQELEEFFHQHERVVRVVFNRVEADGDSGEGKVQIRVEVLVSRVHRPHRRVETESVRLSSYARSKDEYGNAEPAEFREMVGQDGLFAQRLLDQIFTELGSEL